MSGQLPKIIEIYNHTYSLIQAKNQIFVNSQSLLPCPQFVPLKKNSQFETWPRYIHRCLATLLKMWNIKYAMFGELEPENRVWLHHVQAKMTNIKKNKNLLSKQEQLIAEMQEQIKNWNQISDPLVYYDLKKMTSFKQQMMEKVRLIKQNLNVTKKSEAPLYLRQIQQQMKNTIILIYQQQLRIDEKARKIAVSQWQKSVNMINNYAKQLRTIYLLKYISQKKNGFYQQFYDLINKRARLTQNSFIKYFQQMNNFARYISRFWGNYLNNMQQLHNFLSDYVKLFNQTKKNLQKRQENVVKIFNNNLNEYDQILKLNTSLDIVTSFNQIFQIISFMSNFLYEIKGFIVSIQNNLKDSNQYCRLLSSQIKDRERQFYIFSSGDTLFIDRHSKAQMSLQKKLIQSYQKFLYNCYTISRRNYKVFQQRDRNILQPHELGSIIRKQIVNRQPQLQKSASKSQISNTNTTINAASMNMSSHEKHKSKNDKNEKLIEIQQFLSKVYVFDPTPINWKRNNIFSCALGPKLLLHGTIAILQQGLYYESIFNKKNLFFGKTRLFIPRPDILEIGTQNTLIIFPDAVQVKTQVGAVYFHSLSNRETINNTLNEIYFPQNSPNGDQCASQSSFVQVNLNQIQKIPQAQVNQLLKSYEVPMTDIKVKNIKLGKFFKRYYSDNEFEIRGQKYNNFKTYFLSQIQGIDPKCTPLTPEPPTYFFYKNQQSPAKNYPKVSEKIHTYRKMLPKIPFLSSGGEGLCEDKQTYHWVSPQLFVLNMKGTVKGFSLTENMLISIKHVCKQQGSDVSLSVSAMIKFLTQSGTNNLVKGPALGNLKQCMIKMGEIILKYEKGKQNRSGKKAGQQAKTQQNQILQQKIAKLAIQNQKLKKYIKIGAVLSVIIYFITIILLIG